LRSPGVGRAGMSGACCGGPRKAAPRLARCHQATVKCGTERDRRAPRAMPPGERQEGPKAWGNSRTGPTQGHLGAGGRAV